MLIIVIICDYHDNSPAVICIYVRNSVDEYLKKSNINKMYIVGVKIEVFTIGYKTQILSHKTNIKNLIVVHACQYNFNKHTYDNIH